MADNTAKLATFQTRCGNEKDEYGARKKYVVIASEDMIDDVISDFMDICDQPEIISRNADIVEIISEKDLMKKEWRPNGNDILDVVIAKGN